MFFLLIGCSLFFDKPIIKTIMGHKYPINHFRRMSCRDYKFTDSTVSLPLLTVIDTSIFSILDELIELDNQCLHTVMGESIWFLICAYEGQNDSIYFKFTALQYNPNDVVRNIRQNLDGYLNYGCWYYKERLVVVGDMYCFLQGRYEIYNQFFGKTDTTLQIPLYFPDAILYCSFLEKTGPITESSSLSYWYSNGTFAFQNKWSDCFSYFSEYEEIKPYDTLDSLSKRHHVRPEQIIRLNHLKETIFPSEGIIKIQ
jgi:hypothetical protein